MKAAGSGKMISFKKPGVDAKVIGRVEESGKKDLSTSIPDRTLIY
jgi:hypothetical protein